MGVRQGTFTALPPPTVYYTLCTEDGLFGACRRSRPTLAATPGQKGPSVGRTTTVPTIVVGVSGWFSLGMPFFASPLPLITSSSTFSEYTKNTVPTLCRKLLPLSTHLDPCLQNKCSRGLNNCLEFLRFTF